MLTLAAARAADIPVLGRPVMPLLRAVTNGSSSGIVPSMTTYPQPAREGDRHRVPVVALQRRVALAAVVRAWHCRGPQAKMRWPSSLRPAG